MMVVRMAPEASWRGYKSERKDGRFSFSFFSLLYWRLYSLYQVFANIYTFTELAAEIAYRVPPVLYVFFAT